MQKYEVQIVGKTPYMQHKMNDEKLEEWEKKRGKIIERDDINKEDFVRADYHTYKNAKGQYYLPAEHIRAALINAGAFMKAKVGNSKKSMKNVVAGMFYITPEEIILPSTWAIDKRSAVNQNIKARVISIRPKWETWEATFTLLVDNDTITDETVQELFNYAGNYVGIGSFSPRCNGMFGRFETKKIKPIQVA